MLADVVAVIGTQDIVLRRPWTVKTVSTYRSPDCRLGCPGGQGEAAQRAHPPRDRPLGREVSGRGPSSLRVHLDDRKVRAPCREQMKGDMESLIHHFTPFTEGDMCARRRHLRRGRALKGEFGIYLVSDGANKPGRLKCRAPGFVHLAALDEMVRAGTCSSGRGGLRHRHPGHRVRRSGSITYCEHRQQTHQPLDFAGVHHAAASGCAREQGEAG